MAAGGFKMSLGGLKAKPGLKAVAAKNNTKPKKALLGDDEPDDTNKAQEIAGFDAAEGGAIDINGPKEKKGPLVIPALPNRNWREEARRKQLERAPHTQQQNGDVVMDEPEKEVVYGLTVPTKPAEAQENEITPASEAMDVDPKDDLTDAQRLEKQALESLLTGKATDTARVVPAITDEEALRNDLQDAPDEPDVAAYEATPIEGFGLAMLRGMGWKDSDGEARKNGAGGKAPAEVKRRPALLGIGAKADAAKDVELGEFNSKARGKKGQKDAPQGYNPVTLRNKKTGEIVTEEELKRKLESQDLVEEKERGREGEERGERRRDRERRDDGGRDRDRDRDRDRRRDDEYDSERRRDRDRRDDRRRDKYDDDSDRRRDRRRDRDREDDYDSERRREKRRDRDRRDRSRSRSPRDDKRRDRYRSRSRDSKDRRDRRDRSRSRDDEERRRRRKEREYDERDERRKRDREEKSSRR